MSGTESPKKVHWLDRYANNQHAWTLSTSQNGSQCFKRPLGLVENSFDSDGTYFGGRADMTATFKLEVRHTLDETSLRARIANAWTLLRLHHVLLKSRIENDVDSGERCFVVDVPATANQAIQQVEQNITWLEDFELDARLNEQDLHYHALNVTRIIQPKECLSKLHVLPLKPLANGTWELRFLIIMAHQISDGLSAYNWFSHFIKILNTPAAAIERELCICINPGHIKAKLPPAQEDFYPKIPGNIARQRWFWAIMRVLRHVQKTMPRTLTNPLRRAKRLEAAIPLPPTYSQIFDYSLASRPPMSSGHVVAVLSPAASAHMISLCRSVNVSIGAGCFALAGLSMMAIYESLHGPFNAPAFGASFPLNPRAFFDAQPQADSCMLAFSEGIIMPFLPSRLPVDARFKLVAKNANRELRVYQKRLKENDRALGNFDKHSPARLLATGYLAQMERVEDKLPEEKKTGLTPQGQLKPRMGQYGATCGVSSVGSLKAFFKPGDYDLEDMKGKDFVADYRGLRMGVRARENEFLIGSSTDANGLVGFGVSYDENAISQETAQKWADTISGLLEPQDAPKL
ncbi:hypothetical protein BDU57DRAFT_522572 [Ampelomyces quisqualis]|uniref:Condensation domain-containing protein n=1 Tax=Ampelomyces quisqualis TaxID=50730 RepID=A0A6A5QAE5_AMPQU|nr:hypothetical protein BDU57DRAFT_522572 [Ampelomyces quisqualis]